MHVLVVLMMILALLYLLFFLDNRRQAPKARRSKFELSLDLDKLSREQCGALAGIMLRDRAEKKVNEFIRTHPRYREVSGTFNELIKNGICDSTNWEDAYKVACEVHDINRRILQTTSRSN